LVVGSFEALRIVAEANGDSQLSGAGESGGRLPKRKHASDGELVVVGGYWLLSPQRIVPSCVTDRRGGPAACKFGRRADEPEMPAACQCKVAATADGCCGTLQVEAAPATEPEPKPAGDHRRESPGEDTSSCAQQAPRVAA
jgi:hypothetical protein